MNSSLKARFVRVNKPDGLQDFDESYWILSINETDVDPERVLSKSTVKSLIESDPKLDYSTIATKEFGSLLIKNMRDRLNPLKAFW